MLKNLKIFVFCSLIVSIPIFLLINAPRPSASRYEIYMIKPDGKIHKTHNMSLYQPPRIDIYRGFVVVEVMERPNSRRRLIVPTGWFTEWKKIQ